MYACMLASALARKKVAGLGRTSLAAVGAEAIVSRLHQRVQPLLQRLLRHFSEISHPRSLSRDWCTRKFRAKRAVDHSLTEGEVLADFERYVCYVYRDSGASGHLSLDTKKETLVEINQDENWTLHGFQYHVRM